MALNASKCLLKKAEEKKDEEKQQRNQQILQLSSKLSQVFPPTCIRVANVTFYT